MACNSPILFPIIYKDGELLGCVQNMMAICGQVKIKGDKTERAWDRTTERFYDVTGLFISYKEIEYCVPLTLDEFMQLCKDACGQPVVDTHIHDDVYDLLFE